MSRVGRSAAEILGLEQAECSLRHSSIHLDASKNEALDAVHLLLREVLRSANS